LELSKAMVQRDLDRTGGNAAEFAALGLISVDAALAATHAAVAAAAEDDDDAQESS
jgi:hypothetical protein